MIGYPPAGSVSDVVHVVTGRAAVQSVLPEVKVTVPTAPAWRPVAESVEAVPYGTLAGAAAATNEVPARVTVSAVVAVEPVTLVSPE